MIAIIKRQVQTSDLDTVMMVNNEGVLLVSVTQPNVSETNN